MKELDLDRLENTDNDNIQKLSDNFRAVSDKDISRLYKKTEEKYNSIKNYASDGGKAEKINVVRYKKFSFAKILAAVSCIAVIVTGGFLLNKALKNKDDNIVSSDISQTELMTPFGDISECEIRCTSVAYVPYLYKVEQKTAEELSEIFNSEKWIETDEDMAEGETGLIFVKDGEKKLRLIFGGNHIVQYSDGENDVRYKVSDKIWSAGFNTAAPEDFSVLTGKLIPSKTEDITIDGVWKNNEYYPEKLFVPYETPEELEGKTIIEWEPCYEFAYDFNQMENVGMCSDNIVTGKVENITSIAEGSYENGKHAVTDIKITVTGDEKGEFANGETLDLYMLGGYISMRDSCGEILAMEGGKYGEAGDHKSDEEIDNTYYHEIVYSGEVPIINKEYAFYITREKDGYSITGGDKGIFYKCDNLYISKNSNFYDMEDLRAYLSIEENDFQGADKPR